MPGMYTVVFSLVAVTAQQDLFEVALPATAVGFVHSVELSQNTEFGDIQEEELALLFKRGSTTTGSGGSTPTPGTVAGVGQGAAGMTAKVNNTTKATAGTILTLHATNWNVRGSPNPWTYTPEQRIRIAPSERFTIELATTPADSITLSGTLWVEEV